ncbi:carboxyl-terminal-processing peptidase 2, chloroplastic-like [Camellia sinensis]|uniref:carboxyl-terminal-processing peptidase 2, chloroplastic-like n=1 Tax=Camellia sinensis TaxID=4442 RepID=UPI001035FEC2|nr:carboxyl-terminal-processing peptidase 2, chloroplastic-like [Camellia sinensis]
MNTREETYKAIRKMLATLDDPFTRFLEPEKFKSLRLGTQGSLTGVGLSIGYPTGGDGSTAGLVVISTAPVGPANKAGILSGDVILKIDDANTETMGIYDAADRLQGPEGSAVELTIQSGPEIKHLSLVRERVSLNPVQSRLCEITGLGREDSKVGYIKLTSFNQNASGAVREAIETLRRNNVNAFVLDLRDNSGGLFPEGIEIAKIWLEKGVIVYICDSQGVRDIYDTDGSNAIAAREPLAVLVNKGTASASEILAGALKDNKRAVLFGEPTYGKGKIQSVFELSDGSGLAVTVARYETPAHTDIDKVGVVPDHPLPVSFPKDDQGFCSCLHIATPVQVINYLQGLSLGGFGLSNPMDRLSNDYQNNALMDSKRLSMKQIFYFLDLQHYDYLDKDHQREQLENIQKLSLTEYWIDSLIYVSQAASNIHGSAKLSFMRNNLDLSLELAMTADDIEHSWNEQYSQDPDSPPSETDEEYHNLINKMEA